MRLSVKEALNVSCEMPEVVVEGWVKTCRESKSVAFLEINDGSGQKNLQAVLRDTLPHYVECLAGLQTGASVMVRGSLVESEGKGQKWELLAETVVLLGPVDNTYPLQKKGHTVEFLREVAHLRARTNLIGAVLRVRSRMAYAIHNFFQERGFYYVHTPIITGCDCEGAGEMFRVTTLNAKALPLDDRGAPDYSKDFFGRPTYLTVSGQLEAETLACAMGKVYTFGPTFRAENSHTARHASEFWMVEPEMAFCDLEGDRRVAEELIRFLVADALKHCANEVDFFEKFVDKEIKSRLGLVMERPFSLVTYKEAVEILIKSGEKFEYPVKNGAPLQSEHERYLSERYFRSPTTVVDFPKEIKPFYMRLNDDGTVRAMDLLVPKIGEIIGGSQREERLNVLRANMERSGVGEAEYRWYVDLRKYGTVPHSGFGMGFERLIMFVTGVANIRDVIPFPRTPGNAGY